MSFVASSEESLEFNLSDAVDWDDLFYDIQHERAVLVLGPELMSQASESIQEKIYKKLIQRRDNGLNHFYPGSGIFLFSSERYKAKAQRVACETFKETAIDPDLINKIIDLPFKLIINTNPDHQLVNALQAKGVSHQFDYFTWRPRQSKPPSIKEPAINYPFVYNLFGSVNVDDSVILDFEDIYDHLQGLFNAHSMPDIFRNILIDTDSFIFIGFRLERWDTQLLFRYLNMKSHGFDDTKKNYTMKSVDIDNSSEIFVRKQFNVKYYGAPSEFISELFEKCKNVVPRDIDQGFPLDSSDIPKSALIKKMIAADRVEAAINLLAMLKINDPLVDHDAVLIQNRFSRYYEAQKKGTVSIGDLEILRAQVSEALLSIAPSLD